jgi:hypothetical protein
MPSDTRLGYRRATFTREVQGLTYAFQSSVQTAGPGVEAFAGGKQREFGIEHDGIEYGSRHQCTRLGGRQIVGHSPHCDLAASRALPERPCMNRPFEVSPQNLEANYPQRSEKAARFF